MPKDFKVTVIGDAALRRKLSNPLFVRGPLRRWLTKSVLLLEGEVKRQTPVDTGRLRASITHQVQPFRAWVGTNVKYAPFVEFGTRPHFPPPVALQPWARRHGFPPGPSGAFMVAHAIARRGTRARRMFQMGVERAKGRIQAMFQVEVTRDIRNEWRK